MKRIGKFLLAILPFIAFGLIYDSMRYFPNYEFNPIDVRGIYEAEKSIFGITLLDGSVVTPCEYFSLHTSAVADFLAGCFYLCWVPVPVMFALWLYMKGRRQLCFRFSMAFLFVNLIGFVGYYIHPAAPPWYVMEYGFEPILGTPGHVAGLGRFDELTGLPVFHALYAKNANVFAAVPSLHAAYMVVALCYAIKGHCSAGLKWAFSIIMVGIWCTAVYTAHHYVIDVLLGIVTALVGVYLFELIWTRFIPGRLSSVQH